MAKLLDSGTISVFAESIAMMLSVGIQTDEAVHMLASSADDSRLEDVCKQIYKHLGEGVKFSYAIEQTQAFPHYVVEMVQAGEESGYLENVMNSLATYYNEEDRLFAKMRSAVMYPTALLAVMTVILIFTVATILPIFLDLYSNLAGQLYEGSFAYVKVSMGIGYVALAFMALCTVLAGIAAVMSGGGSSRLRLISLMEKLPLSKDAMYHMALARFTSSLSTYVSAGILADRAMQAAINMTDHSLLRKRAQAAYEDMIAPVNPKNLAQAISDHDLFDPLYVRMLLIGSRSGATEDVLNRLSVDFFDDAVVRIDSLIDSVEPSIAAFLTISVGATLIAVMMPLVGIMSSIA